MNDHVKIGLGDKGTKKRYFSNSFTTESKLKVSLYQDWVFDGESSTLHNCDSCVVEQLKFK